MKQNVEDYMEKWRKFGYNKIPEEVPLRIHQLGLAPSYKELCLLILNNEIQKNRNKKSKVYFELKKIELTDKGKIFKSNQLKLNL